MPEQINNIKVFSLLEVTNSIKKTIAERYKSAFWVKVEMNKLNHYPQSGHCYPELVEKQNGKVVVNIKANLWKDDYQRINGKFIKILSEPLKDNITILINVNIGFDPLHGLSLKINDIDPSYTLGELEREKLESIKKLKTEGIFYNNQELLLPVLPKRVAVISVKTSKGYADFLDVINSKKGIYEFLTLLYPSVLQGDNAVKSILSQLDNIEKISGRFDMVAIIRGGGGDIGLSCYNNYELAKRVALYPIPVLTGIGHSTNETVVEMVSHQNSITPTKLAEFLIEKFHNFSRSVLGFEKIIFEKSGSIIEYEKQRIKTSVRLFSSVSRNHLLSDNNDLKNISSLFQRTTKSMMGESVKKIRGMEVSLTEITAGVFKNMNSELLDFARKLKHHTTYSLLEAKNKYEQTIIKIKNSYQNNLNKSSSGIKDFKIRLIKYSPLILRTRNKEIENINKNVELLNPKNVLKRGYSITYLKEKAIKSTSEIDVNTEVNTVLFEGSFKSKVTLIKKDNLK